jgi:hypothetical protein
VSKSLLTNTEHWSTPMTPIPAMICGRGDGIPGLTAKGHTEQQSKMGDQSRQLHQLSIDRPSSAAMNVSIGNPCALVNRAGEIVSKGELMAKVLPDLTAQEISLPFYIAHLRRVVSDSQEDERYVTNVPGRGYCFVVPGGRMASPSTHHLYGCGDLSC